MQQYTAIGTYSDLTTADLTGSVQWLSGNTSVATIDVNGLATGVANGSTTIKATDPLSGINGSTGVTVQQQMPAGAVRLFDASNLSSITRGVYGAVGTPDGQIATVWADLSGNGHNATNGTESSTPFYDEYNINGAPAIVFGGNSDNWSGGNPFRTTTYALPSAPDTVPFTLVVAGRFWNLGTITELSTNVASAPGLFLKNGAIPFAANRASVEQTVTPYQGWTPLSLGAALVSWHRSDLGITVTGSGVSQWLDQSGNGHTLTQATDGARLFYHASGGPGNRPYLSDNGTPNSGLQGSAYGLAEPYTVVTVFAWSSVFGNDYISDFQGTKLLSNGSALFYWIDSGFSNNGGAAGTFGTGSFLIVQGASGSGGTLTVNRASPVYTANPQPTSIQVSPGNGSVPIPLATPTVMNINAMNSGAKGQFCEQFIINRNATSGDIANFQSYFQSIYGTGQFADDTNHCIIICSDGTDSGTTAYVDGVQSSALATNAANLGAGSIASTGIMGASHDSSNPLIGALAIAATYPFKFSPAQAAAATGYHQSKWPLAVQTGSQQFKVWGFGDSTQLGLGVNTNPYLTLLGRLSVYGGPKYGTPVNLAVGATELTIGPNNINSVVAGTVLSTTMPNILLLQGGVNGGDGDPSLVEGYFTTVWNTAQSVCATSGQANLVVVYTITYNSGFDYNAIINPWIRANYASFTTANAKFVLLDAGGDPMLSQINGGGLFSYFDDNLHPSGPGYERLWGLLKPLLAANGF